MTGRAAATLATAMTVLLLAGCSLLGPTRGEDGQVTEPAELNSADLLPGDCFTFLDGTNLAKSTVVPCSDPHEFLVIGQGTLDDATIDTAGGMQNAINAACDEPFAEFRATLDEGTRPQQQFISTTIEEDGVQLTKYSCLATDIAGAVEAQG